MKKILVPLLVLIVVAFIGSNIAKTEFNKFIGTYGNGTMELELTGDSFKFLDNGPYGDADYKKRGEQIFVYLRVCDESTPGNFELHMTRGVNLKGEFIDNFLVITDDSKKSWKFTKIN